MPTAGSVTLSLFDVRGRCVVSRDLGTLPAGTSRVSVASLAPSTLANGVYVLELKRDGTTTETARVTFIR
jgi:hypothetical protein